MIPDLLFLPKFLIPRRHFYRVSPSASSIAISVVRYSRTMINSCIICLPHSP